jgi:hypothetical protein
MSSNLVILQPHDALDKLIPIMTGHPNFQYNHCLLVMGCDGTLTDLDASEPLSLRGKERTRLFLDWAHHIKMPYFVVSARSSDAFHTAEVADRLVNGLKLRVPEHYENHMKQQLGLRCAEMVPWQPCEASLKEEQELFSHRYGLDIDLLKKARHHHVGMRCGHAISSVLHTMVGAALPKTLSVEFALTICLTARPKLLVFVDDMFDNIMDIYLKYQHSKDMHCLCIYYPRPGRHKIETDAMQKFLKESNQPNDVVLVQAFLQQ